MQGSKWKIVRQTPTMCWRRAVPVGEIVEVFSQREDSPRKVPSMSDVKVFEAFREALHRLSAEFSHRWFPTQIA